MDAKYSIKMSYPLMKLLSATKYLTDHPIVFERKGKSNQFVVGQIDNSHTFMVRCYLNLKGNRNLPEFFYLYLGDIVDIYDSLFPLSYLASSKPSDLYSKLYWLTLDVHHKKDDRVYYTLSHNDIRFSINKTDDFIPDINLDMFLRFHHAITLSLTKFNQIIQSLYKNDIGDYIAFSFSSSIPLKVVAFDDSDYPEFLEYSLPPDLISSQKHDSEDEIAVSISRTSLGYLAKILKYIVNYFKPLHTSPLSKGPEVEIHYSSNNYPLSLFIRPEDDTIIKSIEIIVAPMMDIDYKIAIEQKR